MDIITPAQKQAPQNSYIKTRSELERMREAGSIVARAIRKALESVESGITTAELDAIARKEIESLGATPAFLGLYGFPATACISINDEIVHGIPKERPLEKGDVVSIDCGAIVGGMYSDMARTVIVPPSDEVKDALLKATEQALIIGTAKAIPGNRTGAIGHAIENFTRPMGYEVVREYVGHGIGHALHEPPQVPNYGKPGDGHLLLAGMVIAIEPMLNVGGRKTRVLEDNWTVVTADGSLSAHIEDTVAITSEGPEVLTRME